MTAAIDDLLLKQPRRHSIAYFYCSFSNDESLRPQNVLGSLLAQVIEASDPVYMQCESLFDNPSIAGMGNPGRIDVNTLIRMLVEQSKYREELYILIDGVNESTEPSEILQALKTISASPHARILISSIDEKGIRSSIREICNLNIETLRPEDVHEDISLLVHSSLKSHPRLKQLSPQLKEDVVLALTSGAEGM